MKMNINTETVTVYKTTDGELHVNEFDAIEHQMNLIGEALDDLIADDSRGNITRACMHSLLMNTMSDEQFKKKVVALYTAVMAIKE